MGETPLRLTRESVEQWLLEGRDMQLFTPTNKISTERRKYLELLKVAHGDLLVIYVNSFSVSAEQDESRPLFFGAYEYDCLYDRAEGKFIDMDPNSPIRVFSNEEFPDSEMLSQLLIAMSVVIQDRLESIITESDAGISDEELNAMLASKLLSTASKEPLNTLVKISTMEDLFDYFANKKEFISNKVCQYLKENQDQILEEIWRRRHEQPEDKPAKEGEPVNLPF